MIIFAFILSCVVNQNFEWRTKNFVIQSFDIGKGQYLEENIENIKTWVITRWGFRDFDFSKPKLIIVNDGKRIQESIPEMLTLICFEEYNKKYKPLPLWMIRGMMVLNGTYLQIRTKLKKFDDYVEKDLPIYTLNSILFKNYQTELFDIQSSIMVLLLFKEFRPEFHKFLESGDINLLGMSNKEFELTFINYSKRLSKDLINSVTPDSYLQIK